MHSLRGRKVGKKRQEFFCYWETFSQDREQGKDTNFFSLSFNMVLSLSVNTVKKEINESITMGKELKYLYFQMI